MLLADEPTGNLDEDTKSEIMSVQEVVRANRELTLVIATHDSNVARQAPRTARVKRGQLTLKQNQATGPAAMDLEPA